MKTLTVSLLQSLLLVSALAVSVHVVAAEDIWIDVRTQQEYAGEHLDGATNIPHTAIGEQIVSLTEDKDAPIKLYCRSGGRAGMAKKTLEDLGYTNVENIGGLEDAKKMAEAE